MKRCERCRLTDGTVEDLDGSIRWCDHGALAAALADVEARDRAREIRARYDREEQNGDN